MPRGGRLTKGKTAWPDVRNGNLSADASVRGGTSDCEPFSRAFKGFDGLELRS
jgi:hypothetical protein